MTRTIGYIVGSISSTSINRTLSRVLVRLAPQDVEMVEIPIAQLPFFSPDFEADYPPVGLDFKAAIAAVDGVIIVTPEYSRSIPGVLKNALDWAARPAGQGAFRQVPAATIGTSRGGIGTAAGQQHLRAVLLSMGAIVMGQPEAYIQTLPGLFTDDGEVTNEGTATFLSDWMRAFVAHVEMVRPARA